MNWYVDYIGIPFKSLGRDKLGCDCYGLVRIVLKEHYNKDIPDLQIYKDAMDKEEINSIIDEGKSLLHGTKIDNPEEGAIVVFTSNKGLESHIGLLVTDRLVLHTKEGIGAVIEPIEHIKQRIKGYYNV